MSHFRGCYKKVKAGFGVSGTRLLRIRSWFCCSNPGSGIPITPPSGRHGGLTRGQSASRANPRIKFSEAARSVNLMIPPRADCHQSALAGGRWGYGFEQAGTKTGISPGTRQACEEGVFLLTYAAATTGDAPLTQLLTTTPPRTSQVAIVVYDAGT